MKWVSKLWLLVIVFSSSAFTNESVLMKKENPVLIIETTAGTFEVTLFPNVAPKTCENFLKLAETGYYNGILFHRIIPSFMIQGGDPNGTGAGGTSIWGKPFEDECHKDLKFNKPGILAMANRGPNTNGSQFFITTTSTSWLNMKHTIFGEVTKGYDVIQKMESFGSPSGKPSTKVQIVKISLKQ